MNLRYSSTKNHLAKLLKLENLTLKLQILRSINQSLVKIMDINVLKTELKLRGNNVLNSKRVKKSTVGLSLQ